MIIGGALAEWFGDGPARSRAIAERKAVAAEFGLLPEVARLESALAAAGGAGADDILDLARVFVESPGLIDRMTGLFVEASARNPFYRPHFGLATSAVHSGFVLLDRPQLTIQAVVVDADAIAAKRAERTGGASIVFTGERSLFRVLRSGGATFSFWEAQPIRPGFTEMDSGRCRLARRRRIEDGETFDLDGASQAFVVEGARRNLVYLQASTPLGAAPLRVEYDSASHAFVGASSTDEASSRMQMMLALLRILDRRDAVPVFREMLAAEHFYMRWQTMRELLALDSDAALPHLRAMACEDPHPEVREAAARTLEQFFPEAQRSFEAQPCPA